MLVARLVTRLVAQIEVVRVLGEHVDVVLVLQLRPLADVHVVLGQHLVQVL